MPGRNKSPVQQAWEYATQAAGVKWVLVCNYVELRMYGFGEGTEAYEKFQLDRLTEPEEYARFMLLLSAENLLSGRVADLLQESRREDKDITDSLYNDYKKLRLDLLSGIQQAEAGFTKVEVRGKSGDGGIDGVGVLRVNLVSFQVYFQCKRWKGSVGSKEIRDFRGALQGRADKGLFITTGHFTSQASDEATRDGAIAIDLIDGDRLCELLKDNRLGVATEMIEQVRIHPDWFDGI